MLEQILADNFLQTFKLTYQGLNLFATFCFIAGFSLTLLTYYAFSDFNHAFIYILYSISALMHLFFLGAGWAIKLNLPFIFIPKLSVSNLSLIIAFVIIMAGCLQFHKKHSQQEYGLELRKKLSHNE